jgi:hypothetical protein
MPALPKSTHFDIADACRDIPESTEGLLHPVMARGNDGQTVFPTESDYETKGVRSDFGIGILKQLMALGDYHRVDKGTL